MPRDPQAVGKGPWELERGGRGVWLWASQGATKGPGSLWNSPLGHKWPWPCGLPKGECLARRDLVPHVPLILGSGITGPSRWAAGGPAQGSAPPAPEGTAPCGRATAELPTVSAQLAPGSSAGFSGTPVKTQMPRPHPGEWPGRGGCDQQVPQMVLTQADQVQPSRPGWTVGSAQGGKGRGGALHQDVFVE